MCNIQGKFNRFLNSENLWLINLVCQTYCVTFTSLTLWLAFTVTLPEYCKHEKDCLYQRRLLVGFLFLNMIVNYACIQYKAKFNCVSEENIMESLPRKSLLLDSPFIKPTPFKIVSTNQNSNSDKSNYIPEAQGFDNSSLSIAHNGDCSSYKRNCNPECNNQSNDSCSLDLSSQDKLPPVLVPADWKFCYGCEMRVPPRAKHCPLCDCCVLKRDHHCFFTGKCIGFYNQGHFVMFCLYCTLGAIYSVTIMLPYMNVYNKAILNWGFFGYLPPVFMWSWLFGYSSVSDAALIIFFEQSLAIGSACGFYFFKQLIFVARGQTEYEYGRGDRMYKGTVMTNVRSVFGPYWPLNVIVPIPCGSYEGNGMSWNHLCNAPKVL